MPLFQNLEQKSGGCLRHELMCELIALVIENNTPMRTGPVLERLSPTGPHGLTVGSVMSVKETEKH